MLGIVAKLDHVPMAVVRFQHITGGLKAKGDKLEGFALAGADGNFVPADAAIDGNAIGRVARAMSQVLPPSVDLMMLAFCAV